jgi:hypothetical protein
VDADTPDIMEPFETWLLQQAAQPVHAGEVAADLLMERRAEIEAARVIPKDEGRSMLAAKTTRPLEMSPRRPPRP